MSDTHPDSTAEKEEQTSEGDQPSGISHESVDSGYGDSVARSTGNGGMDRTTSQALPDSPGQETGGEKEEGKSPLDNSAETPSALTSTQLVSGPPGWTWSERAVTAFNNEEARQYHPPESDIPYTLARSRVTQGLETVGTRVRPELAAELRKAIADFESQFPNSRCYDADFYEAAFTVALWHYDEVMALLAEFGYGYGVE